MSALKSEYEDKRWKERLQEEKDKTMKECLKMLKLYHKCMIERPTGFGKTFMASRLSTKYSKVLFLYPSISTKAMAITAYKTIKTEEMALERESEDSIKNELSYESELNSEEIDYSHIEFMTYMALINKSDEELDKLRKSTLIILDECHKAGAKCTKEALDKLLLGYNGDLVGITATPMRTDSFDVAKHFFNNKRVYKYDIRDAMDDGIFFMPNYVYCVNDNVKYTMKTLDGYFRDRLTEKERKSVYRQVLESKNFKYYKPDNMSVIIKDMVSKYAHDIDKQVYMVFYSHIGEEENVRDISYEDINSLGLKEMQGEVSGWFCNAFLDHNIIDIPCTSTYGYENRKIIDNINLDDYDDNTIILIHCVDMFNESIHIKGLTGVVFMRKTNSNIIYQQQFGRTLSVTNHYPGIILDVVDNIHTKSMFSLLSDDIKKCVKDCTEAEEELIDEVLKNLPRLSVKQRGEEATLYELIYKLAYELIWEKCRLICKDIERFLDNNKGMPLYYKKLIIDEILDTHQVNKDDYVTYVRDNNKNGGLDILLESELAEVS